MFEVVMIRTFFRAFSLSNCVSRAFTTRRPSVGSLPDMAAERAAVRDSTSSETINYVRPCLTAS